MSRDKTLYEKYFKRAFDIFCSLCAIICLSPIYIVVGILVRVKLGSPIIFKQYRPGLNERIFPMYKFRTMTNEVDEKGELLPDEVRLTSFGKWLRASSLDELPELFNILLGDMSVIGPRPQLVRDMVFMTNEQRRRHSVMPGLSGWAQVNGRNAISWESKIKYDLEYIDRGITFWGDVQIILSTVMKAFVKQEGINADDMATAEDFGDYLLRVGQVTQGEYEEKQAEARGLLEKV